jgi:hypothetical protein
MIHFRVFYHICEEFVVEMFTSEELLKSLAHRVVVINVGKLLIMAGPVIGDQKTNRIRGFVSISKINQ